MSRIVIAEDDILLGELVTELLRQSPEFSIIGRVTTGEDVLAAVRRAGADLLLLDVNLPGIDGWQVLEQLRRSRQRARVVMMSVHYSPEAVRKARALGACEYLDKRQAAGTIHEVLRRVAAGETWFQRHRHPRGGKAAGHPAGAAASSVAGRTPLTGREREIARLICSGNSNSEIAAALAISKSTVVAHVSHILIKLEARNRSDIARIVVQRGLVDRR